MVAIEAKAGFEAVVAAGLVGAGLPDVSSPRRGTSPSWPTANQSSPTYYTAA
jgi:hypothetical protein